MADWNIALVAAGDGTGSSWANRQVYTFANLQAAITQLTAGDTLRTEEGVTFTLTGDLSLVGNDGSKTSPITWMTVVLATGVEGTDVTRLDADSTYSNALAAANKQGWRIRGVEVANSTSHGYASSGYNQDFVFENVRATNCGNDGFALSSGIDVIVMNSFFSGNTGDGLSCNKAETAISFCQSIGNGADGFNFAGNVAYIIAHNNTGDGVEFDANPFAFHVIADGNANGVRLSNSDGFFIAGLRATNNSSYGVNANVSLGVLHTCGYYNNTSGDILDTSGDVRSVNQQTLTSAGYNDIDNDDFTLASDGEGVGASYEVGNKSESTNFAFVTSGLPPEYLEPGECPDPPSVPTNRQHGIESDTYEKFILDSGAIYTDFVSVASPGTLLGATRGGSVFKRNPTYKELPYEGIPGQVAGQKHLTGVKATLEVNIISFDTDNLALALPNSAVNSVDDDYNEVVETEWDANAVHSLTNIAIVAQLSGNENPVVIVLDNPISEKDIGLAFKDKSEATSKWVFSAFYKESVGFGAPPWRIYWPK